ncbi:hypothetical protein GpartN1_g1621.t1 [Galdieria partita]|uniref:Pentatricopeptide repeat-containing protein n=1 Tax=Galdieria partita TaxID=83374 RepID=A0A9C7PSU1_9RHOD|nr:hypothetical protein GpartN1_g1621.t1 [Galdieria partita]
MATCRCTFRRLSSYLTLRRLCEGRQSSDGRHNFEKIMFQYKPVAFAGTLGNAGKLDANFNVPCNEQVEGESYPNWTTTEETRGQREQCRENSRLERKVFVSIRRLLYRDDWFQQRKILKERYPRYKLMLPLVCIVTPESTWEQELLQVSGHHSKLKSVILESVSDESRFNWLIDKLSSSELIQQIDKCTMLQISESLRKKQRYRDCLLLWERWEKLVQAKEWSEWKDIREVLHELILCYSGMGVEPQVDYIANILLNEDDVDSETASVLFDIYTNETHAHLVNVIKAMQLLLKCPTEKQTSDITWLQLAKAMVTENPLDHGKWALLFINHLDKERQLNFFNHYLLRLSHVGRHDLGLDALQEMKNRGLQPDEYTVAAIMRAFTNSNHYQEACEAFESMQKEFHVKYGDFALSELLIAVSRDGQLNSILGVLDSLLQLGHRPSNAAIRSILLEVANSCGIDEALASVEFIARRNVPISSKVLDQLLLVAKNSGEWKYARIVFWLYSKYGKLPNYYTFELLMRTLTRHSRGERMINRVQPGHPLLSSDNSEAARILADLSEMYNWMLRAGVFPTAWIVREMIRAAASGGHPNVANEVLFYASNVLGVNPTEDSFEFLVNAYAKVNDIVGVSKSVRLMKEKLGKPSLRALNIWMRSCLRVGDIALCQQIFEEILLYGYDPNEHTFACLIAAAGAERNLQRGHELLRKMIDKGLYPNSSVYVTLLKAVESCQHVVSSEFLEFLFQGLERGDWQPDGYLLARLIRIGYHQQQFYALERIYHLLEKNRNNIALSQLQLPLYELVKGALSLGCSSWAVDWIRKFAFQLNVRPTSALRYAAIYEWLRLGVIEAARDAVVCATAETWNNNTIENIWSQVWKEMGDERATPLSQTDNGKDKNDLYPHFLQRVRQSVQESLCNMWHSAQSGHVDEFWKQCSKRKDNSHPLQLFSSSLRLHRLPSFDEGWSSSCLESIVLHENPVCFSDKGLTDPLIVIANAGQEMQVSRMSHTGFPMKGSQPLLYLPGGGSFAAWNIYIETCLLGPVWLRPLTGQITTDEYILRRFESVFSVYSLEAMYAIEYLENKQAFVSESLVRQVLDRISYLQRWKPNRIWSQALQSLSQRKKDRLPFRFSGLYE